MTLASPARFTPLLVVLPETGRAVNVRYVIADRGFTKQAFFAFYDRAHEGRRTDEDIEAIAAQCLAHAARERIKKW